jgi:hypothetical protein
VWDHRLRGPGAEGEGSREAARERERERERLCEAAGKEALHPERERLEAGMPKAVALDIDGFVKVSEKMGSCATQVPH